MNARRSRSAPAEARDIAPGFTGLLPTRGHRKPHQGVARPGNRSHQLGAADKAGNLVGCKSPYHQLPVFGWLAISDACGGNKACSARIKASAALQGYCCGGNDLGGEQTRRDSVGINRHEAVMAEI